MLRMRDRLRVRWRAAFRIGARAQSFQPSTNKFADSLPEKQHGRQDEQHAAVQHEVQELKQASREIGVDVGLGRAGQQEEDDGDEENAASKGALMAH